MSLTGTHHAFASIDEHGLNTVIHAFFSARPHLLHYGSIPFVAASSVSATQVSAIGFPGVPGGIPYEVELDIPVVDLFPASGPLPAPLALHADQLAISTAAIVTLGCMEGSSNSDRKGALHPVSTKLDVVAIGHPVSAYFSPGVGWVEFRVDQVVVEGIEPTSLRAVLDCLLEMILNAVLSGLQLPFNIINVDFFKVALEEGPTIADNQLEIWGDVS
jgi:hypothetical protein